MAKNLLLDGKVYDCQDGESVLEALLRQNIDVPYSCKKQNCLSCLMISLNGTPPIKSQRPLKETQQLQNQFLACGCYPVKNMEIAFQNTSLVDNDWAEVVSLNILNNFVLEAVLQCEKPLNFHAGQSVLLFNAKNVGKNFSITNPTSTQNTGRLEIHIDYEKEDTKLGWLSDNIRVGEKFKLGAVSGQLFYQSGDPWQSILLVAWQVGLSAIIGIIQDVFEHGHSGEVYLFHNVVHKEQLYYVDELIEISDYFPNFHFVPCVEQRTVSAGYAWGSVGQAMQKILPDLSGWKLFLSGGTEQVKKIQKQAYLAGADLQNIYYEVTSLPR